MGKASFASSPARAEFRPADRVSRCEAVLQARDVHQGRLEIDLVPAQWLREQLGTTLTDMVVITTGKHAYRRQDGVAVVPAALLGP